MSALDSGISLLKYTGLWRPQYCTVGWKSHVYSLYSISTISLVFALFFFEFVGLTMTLDDVRNVANRCTVMIALFTSCGKIATLSIHRLRILQLLQNLKCDPHRGQDPGEEEALEIVNGKIRFRSKFFIWMKTVTLILMLYLISFICISRKVVWIDIWLPYQFAPNIQYVVVMSLEIVGHFTSGVMAMGYDAFVPGMMMQISAQLQLLQYRIQTRLKAIESHSPNIFEYQDQDDTYSQRKMIAGWLRHHNFIYQYAAELNAIFSPLICLQYASSTILLCVNVYALAQVPVFSLHFLRSLLYLPMLFAQIYMLCLAGTEVMDDSTYFSRSIYVTHWYLLNQGSKKSMTIMMTRSLVPIKFTSAGVIEISLESFVRLVKISYSAYNCLERFTPEE